MPLDRRTVLLAALVLGRGAASAQTMKPPGMSAGEAVERRHPQPVRVGDLIGRRVLQPIESQPVLGRVERLVRRGNGAVDVILRHGGVLARFGGVFGLGSRPIAVPLTAMVALGEYMEVVDLTPDQLDALPNDDGSDAVVVPVDDMVRVGLARPSH